MATLLEAALDYGAAGLEVFPCSPIDKTPFVSQYSATADADQITAWWTWRSDALIGCRIPDRYVVIDIDPRHSGDTTWRTLKAELDGIPFTRVSASGRGDGGIHVWFTLPGGVSEKQLSAKGLNVWAEAHSVGEPILKDGDQIGWSSGLDILRHTHRYSILPPSPHPETRKPYRWVEDRGIDVEPASLPELLSKLIIAPPKPPRAERTRTVRQGLSPADWYSEWADWGDLLGEAGWELVSRDGDEDGSLWQHPTATNAYSASIQHHQLFVFSPNTPFPVCGDGGANGQTAFRALAALKHGGDMSAASAEAIALQQAEMESNPIVDVLDREASNDESDPETDDPLPGYFFTTKGAIIPARLGRYISTKCKLRLGTDGRICRYDGGVYNRDGDMWVRRTVQELVGESFRKHHHDEVLSWLRPMLDTIPERPPTRYLNVANGIIDLDTGELLDHDPKIPSTIRIPVMWNPDATCPRVDQFLADVLPDDTVDLMIELIGYALYAGNPLAKAVLLLGPAGNGKSKLLMLIRALLGDANVSSIPLQTLSENRFAAAQIYGKLANICGDLDARSIKRSDLFKQITGGDVIMAEHKYGHPFNFTSYALPIFSANEAPLSSDQTEAWFDRWLIVPMEARFRGTDREDPFIERKITAPIELEGLLVKTVEALRTLLSRGKFLVPRSVQTAGEGYRDRLDSVRAFVSEECIIDLLHPNLWTSRSALYQGYRRWAQNSGRQSLSNASFNARLRQDFKLEEKGRKGQRGWGGISYGLVSERVEAA